MIIHASPGDGWAKKYVDKRQCKEEGCKTRPTFNIEGKKVALYCNEHKKEGMVDVKHKTCQEEGCKTLPVFNIEGEKVGLYCNEHKKEGMVDVVSKTCQEEGCKKQPTFNKEGEKVGFYCNEHKKEGMVDVKHKTCQEEGCKKQPTFNIEGKKVALYCSQHKKAGMVNVVSKTCKEEGCKTLPTFNKEGEKVGLYCNEHKKEGMVDVKHKTCQEEGCKTRPAFNKEGEKVALYCNEHKKAGMVDVVSKTCQAPLCGTRASNPLYEGYCLRCCIYLRPDIQVVRNYKTKEIHVADYIIGKFPDFTWVEDKRVQDGCSSKRPDLLVDMGSHVVIVEIDEDKHGNYECSCENVRVMQISKDNGHRPIIFIRFNPDGYTDSSGKKVKSCWKINENGICVVSKTKEWERRLKCLEETVEYWTENPTDKTVETIHLYYDE